MRYLSLTILVFCLSACRFGNHSDSIQPPSDFTSIDLITTQASQFETHVYYTDDSNQSRTDVALSQIPENLLTNFSNPLYFAQLRNYPGLYMFVGLSQTSECLSNPEQSGCVETIMDKDGYMNVFSEGAPMQFGPNPACLMKAGMKQLGYLDETNQTVFEFSDGSTETSRGNLLLDYTFTRTFQGDCTEILTTLASCYTNGTGCSTDELAWSSLLFDVYVKAGVLDPHDAARIKSLEYIVHFQ